MATGTDLLTLYEAPGTGPVPDDFQVFGKLPGMPTKEFRVPASRLRGGAGTGGPTKDYVSTETLGGISAGDAFTTDDATLVKLLVKYQAPGFTSFTLGGQGSQTVEVGTPFAAGFKSFAWATSNSQNVTPNSLVLRDMTTATNLATSEANDGNLSASTVAYTAVLGETHRFRLSGLNSQAGTFSADLVHAGAYLLFYGPTTAAPTNRASALALGSSQLATGGGTLVLNTGATARTFAVLLPPGRSLSGVVDLDALGADLTAQYAASPVTIADAAGAPVSYTRYVMQQAVPYATSHRHQFSFS